MRPPRSYTWRGRGLWGQELPPVPSLTRESNWVSPWVFRRIYGIYLFLGVYITQNIIYLLWKSHVGWILFKCRTCILNNGSHAFGHNFYWSPDCTPILCSSRLILCHLYSGKGFFFSALDTKTPDLSWISSVLDLFNWLGQRAPSLLLGVNLNYYPLLLLLPPPLLLISDLSHPCLHLVDSESILHPWIWFEALSSTVSLTPTCGKSIIDHFQPWPLTWLSLKASPSSQAVDLTLHPLLLCLPPPLLLSQISTSPDWVRNHHPPLDLIWGFILFCGEPHLHLCQIYPRPSQAYLHLGLPSCTKSLPQKCPGRVLYDSSLNIVVSQFNLVSEKLVLCVISNFQISPHTIRLYMQTALKSHIKTLTRVYSGGSLMNTSIVNGVLSHHWIPVQCRYVESAHESWSLSHRCPDIYQKMQGTTTSWYVCWYREGQGTWPR